MIKQLLTLAFVFSSLSATASMDKEGLKAEMGNVIKAECADEISKANCGNEHGPRILKCIHEYKKTHKEFLISDKCKDVRKKMKTKRKEFRAAHRIEKKAKQEAKKTEAAKPAPAPTEAAPVENK